MSTLTIRLADDKHERLNALAEARKISVNELIDELATIALASYDARLRFEMRAGRGSARKALECLWECIERGSGPWKINGVFSSKILQGTEYELFARGVREMILGREHRHTVFSCTPVCASCV